MKKLLLKRILLFGLCVLILLTPITPLTLAKYYKNINLGDLNISITGQESGQLSYTLYYHSYNENGDYILETQPVYGEDAVITFRDRPTADENSYVADRTFIGWLLSGIDEVNNNSSMIRYGNGNGMTKSAVASDLYYRQRGSKRILKEVTSGETTYSWQPDGSSFQYWTDADGNKVIHLFDVYEGPVLRAEIDDEDDFVSETTFGAGHFDISPGIEIYPGVKRYVNFEQYYDNDDATSRFYYLKSFDAYYEFYFHPGIDITFTEVSVRYTINNGTTNYEKKSYMRDENGVQMKSEYLEDRNYTYYSYNPTPSNATEKKENTGGECFAYGTLITLADGNRTTVEQLSPGDLVRVYDHENGCYTTAPILFVENDGVDEYKVINLEFSNCSQIKIIFEHGLFDLDLNKYVYITDENYMNFIGHKFAKEKEVGYEIVTLENAYISMETIGCYSLTTNYHLNYFIEGMFSMPGGITGLFNYFEYDENLAYDKELMKTDIDKYGLYTTKDFEKYLTEDLFNEIYPVKYLKVSVGKGLMTFEDIILIIDKYVKGHGIM